METKQMVKTVIIFAISFVLCVVAMCFAPTNKKDSDNGFWEPSNFNQDDEQLSICSADELELYVEITDYGC